MKEKLVFVPSGTVIAQISEGVDPKVAIELHGHDAGVFVPVNQLSKIDKKLAQKYAQKKGKHENKA